MSPELDEEVVVEGAPLSEDDIVVEVIDTRPVEDQVEPAEKDADPDDLEATEEELHDVSERVKKRINKLTFKYNDQRRVAEAAVKMQEEAIRFAEQQRNENQVLRETMHQGEGMLVEEIRHRTKSDVVHAKTALSSALSEGDYDLIAESQASLNRAQIEEHRVEIYQPAENFVQQQPQQQVQQQQAPIAQQDHMFEDWKSKNDWFDSDPVKHNIAMTIHEDLKNSAVSTGVPVGSVEYYNQIDSTMKATLQRLSGVKGESEPAANPAPSVVAPTSRNSRGSGRSPRTVQLTETEASLAKRLNLTPAQFAIEKIKLENENV